MARTQSANNFNQRLIVLTLVGLCVLATISLSSARYLPTRSDESRRERIKEVLRLLLDLPSESGIDMGRTPYEYQSGGGSAIAKRDVHSVSGMSRNNN